MGDGWGFVGFCTVDEVHRRRDGPVNDPSPRVGEPPRHDVAQHRGARPVEGASQLFELDGCLRVEAGLVADAVAEVSRVGGSW